MSVFDIVLTGGRVMDPGSGRDEIANVGISDGTIQAITNEPLEGLDSIDAAGLVVAPGAIDMHSHGQDEENYRVQARDGVTTALELEAGVLDIDDWYGEREGKTLINFGASIGHIPVRMKVMNDPGAMLPIADAAYSPASPEQVEEMKRLLDLGLRRGALAMGFGLQYTPMAARWEVLEMFRVAARYGASCHVHMRGMGHKEPMNSIEGLSELIAASATSGAPLHLVHINSSGMRAVPRLLQMIEEARGNNLDVTTECYPYSAAMTGIESALLAEGWQDVLGIDYDGLEWAETGERLTASTFAEYREIGGAVIMHMIPRADDGRGRDQPAHRHGDRRLSEGRSRPPEDVGLLLQDTGLLCERDGGALPDGRHPQGLPDAGPAPGASGAALQEEGQGGGGLRRRPDAVRPGPSHRPRNLPGPDRSARRDAARARKRRAGRQGRRGCRGSVPG